MGLREAGIGSHQPVATRPSLTRAALAAAILGTVLVGGFFVGALGALIEDTVFDLDDDDG